MSKAPYIPKNLEEYSELDTEKNENYEKEDGVPKPKNYKSKLGLQKLLLEETKKSKGNTNIIKRMITDMQINELEPLQILGSKVTGGLFDRVKFLKDRISETEAAMAERKILNEKFNRDIDEDIEDMKRMITHISNDETLREFKLNLTLLRMEKRKENTSFWRDVVALREQLQELSEQYQVELKISDIFSNLNKDG